MVVSFDHDFDSFPELSNVQLESLEFVSPHPQITSDFQAEVVKVTDGDTVRLRTDFRDFDFQLRVAFIDAPELSTGSPGEEARDFLASWVEGETVTVLIDPNNRVEKYGRLLGDIVANGLKVSEVMIGSGHAVPFNLRREGSLPDLNKDLRIDAWV